MAGFFKSLFSYSTQTPDRYVRGQYWQPLHGFNSFTENYNFLKDFQEIPELNAILNIRARAMSSGIVSVVSISDPDKPATNQESIVRILRSPNWFQGQAEFWKQSCLFRDIFGNEFIYFNTPIGMPNSYKGMFTLNPLEVELKYKPDTPYFLQTDDEAVKYGFKLPNSKILPLDKSNLIHLNDNRVDPKDRLLGTSKLEALQKPLQNIRAAYKKRNIALNMPIGIISNGSKDALANAIPYEPTEKEELQTDLRAHGPLPIITNMAVSYDALNVNASQMGLFEETIEDTGRLCDAFGVPYKLLSSAKAGTLNVGGGELKESQKMMYENSIIPDMEEKIDALNLRFEQIKGGKLTWMVKVDYSHLPVFSEDVKERSDSLLRITSALSKALADGAISIDQYKEELKKYGI